MSTNQDETGSEIDNKLESAGFSPALFAKLTALRWNVNGKLQDKVKEDCKHSDVVAFLLDLEH